LDSKFGTIYDIATGSIKLCFLLEVDAGTREAPLAPNLASQEGKAAADRPDEDPSEPATSTPPRVGLGSTALTKSGREARSEIIAALKRLGIPSETWLPLVGPEPNLGHRKWIPNQHNRFIPPKWEQLEQSPEEWKTLADAAWHKHRDSLMAQWQSMAVKGLDEPTQARKNRRRSGKPGRNAGFEQRYEWAALRLTGVEWKQIAFQYCVNSPETQLGAFEDVVRKGATKLLRLAGLDPAGNKKDPA
jgi:hypothetical protein